MDYRKGAYSVYDLKYHIIFCTKYRYRILTGSIAIRTRELIRENKNI
ncbi:MAG: transposase [Holosporales bacterium]|nr:transposase [Holosporales bacterium]